jgi:DNA excision repair protein ERCC-4
MVQAAPLLNYEQQLLHDLLEEDALCITAAGLGWQKYVAVLLRHHSQSGSPGCVLVIGANPLQRKQIQQELQRQQDPTGAPLTAAGDGVLPCIVCS